MLFALAVMGVFASAIIYGRYRKPCCFQSSTVKCLYNAFCGTDEKFCCISEAEKTEHEKLNVHRHAATHLRDEQAVLGYVMMPVRRLLSCKQKEKIYSACLPPVTSTSPIGALSVATFSGWYFRGSLQNEPAGFRRHETMKMQHLVLVASLWLSGYFPFWSWGFWCTVFRTFGELSLFCTTSFLSRCGGHTRRLPAIREKRMQNKTKKCMPEPTDMTRDTSYTVWMSAKIRKSLQSLGVAH